MDHYSLLVECPCVATGQQMNLSLALGYNSLVIGCHFGMLSPLFRICHIFSKTTKPPLLFPAPLQICMSFLQVCQIAKVIPNVTNFRWRATSHHNSRAIQLIPNYVFLQCYTSEVPKEPNFFSKHCMRAHSSTFMDTPTSRLKSPKRTTYHTIYYPSKIIYCSVTKSLTWPKIALVTPRTHRRVLDLPSP